jgi:hypothetical protein
MADIATVTITTPNDGYVIVEGKCYASFTGTTASNKIYVQIDESAGGSQDFPYTTRAGMDAYPTTGEYLFPVYASRVYFKAKGTYTFRMEGNVLSGSSGSRTAYHAILTAQYFPASYGSVGTVVSALEAAAFEQRTPAVKEPAETGANGPSAGTAYDVDLRELELRAVRAQQAADAARLELWRARLEKADAAPHNERVEP